MPLMYEPLSAVQPAVPAVFGSAAAVHEAYQVPAEVAFGQAVVLMVAESFAGVGTVWLVVSLVRMPQQLLPFCE